MFDHHPQPLLWERYSTTLRVAGTPAVGGEQRALAGAGYLDYALWQFRFEKFIPKLTSSLRK